MTFDEILAQIIEQLRRQGRVSYGAIKRRYDLDDDYLEDLKVELVEAQQLAVDENGRILVWAGNAESGQVPAPSPVSSQPKPTIQQQFPEGPKPQ